MHLLINNEIQSPKKSDTQLFVYHAGKTLDMHDITTLLNSSATSEPAKLTPPVIRHFACQLERIYLNLVKNALEKL